VICCDPFVEYWPELDEQVLSELPSSRGIDAIVFAVPHDEYKSMGIKAWLNGSTPAVLDSNDVLTKEQRKALMAAGCRVASIGRGDDL
jgi:UDP-N-acetyl-D-glucosamine dehydrogenase